MQFTTPLPDDAVEGASGHIADHDKIRAALAELRTALGGTAALYVQETEPTVTGPAVWYQTDGSGNIIDIKVQVS